MPKRAALTALVGGGGIVSLALALVAGGATGVGTYTFVYAEGASYLTDDPRACANCHVMQEHYDGWTKSSHHAAATCNDCHVPPGFPSKYLTKAANGFNHSLAFTSGRFHEPIQITDKNRRITEAACRHCHEDIVQAIDAFPRHGQQLSCVRCHADVGHLR